MKRAKKAGLPKAGATSGGRGARRLLAVAVTLLLVAALLFGLWRAGEEARRSIGPRDRYAVQFSDIQCAAPPNTTRETFLVEVSYNANVAPTFQALDPNLQTQLTTAFAGHPWVERVDAVTVEPPNTVNVKLTFRTPVLAIPVGDSKRAVDAKGILLPATAPTEGLPELLSPVGEPGKAGMLWPDDTVIRAAAVAAEYKPKTIERTTQGWQLIQPDGKKLMVGR